MKCAGLPPACGQAALRTAGGSTTFGTPSSTVRSRGRPAPAPACPAAASCVCRTSRPTGRSRRAPAARAARSAGRARDHDAGSAAQPAQQAAARPRTPFGAVASCARLRSCRLGLIGLALAAGPAAQAVPRPARARGCPGGQRLQPRLQQRRIAAVDLMLRPQQAREVAQQRIGRRVARHLVPQRRGALRSRRRPPSAPPRAAGRGSRSRRVRWRPACRTRRSAAARLASLVPAAVASARFIAVRYSTAAA